MLFNQPLHFIKIQSAVIPGIDILYGVGISREGSLIDFGVEHEIDRAKAELAHLGTGGAIGAGTAHLLEERLGDLLAGEVVAGEEVERFALPAPVLHDLRGQLDEIPRHVRAGETPHRHVRERVVE